MLLEQELEAYGLHTYMSIMASFRWDLAESLGLWGTKVIQLLMSPSLPSTRMVLQFQVMLLVVLFFCLFFLF